MSRPQLDIKREAAPRRRRDPGTADRILDVAEVLVQERGFNGFSYAHIAFELGMTKAGLHYHFRGKAELGEALIDRYARRFADALATIDGTGADAPDKLAAYADLYADVLRRERMCLCGILAAEYRTLPPPMCEAIVRFLDANENWLARVLAEGRARRDAHVQRGPGDAARALCSRVSRGRCSSRAPTATRRASRRARHACSPVSPGAERARPSDPR